MEKFVIFVNARSISELMLCIWKLTKLDILSLLSSDCREWALKLSEHLKKKYNIYFCLHFGNSNFNVIFFCTFSRLRQSQKSVNYRGNNILIRRNKDVNLSCLKYKKNPNMVNFPDISLISPNFLVVYLQPYAWLESFDRYGSFGTMIWG